MVDGYRVSLADIYGNPQLDEEEARLRAAQGRQSRAYVPTASTATPVYSKSSEANQNIDPAEDKRRRDRERAQKQQDVLGSAGEVALGYQLGSSGGSAAAATTAAPAASTATAASGGVARPAAVQGLQAARGSTGVTGGSAGSGYGSAAGYGALAYGVSRAYTKLSAYKQRGGNLTDDEVNQGLHHRGANKVLEQYVERPLEKAGLSRISPKNTNPALFIAKKIFGSSKNDDQIRRDRIRANLKSSGAVDEGYHVRLADGTKYNIGVDGNATLLNKQGGERRAYETDETNELTPQAIAYTNPLGAIITGGDEKLRSDQAGYYTNAITSNAVSSEDARRNAITLYQDHGIDYYTAHDEVDNLVLKGAIDKPTADAYHDGINQTFNYYGEGSEKSSKRVGGPPETPDFGGGSGGRGGRSPNLDDILPDLQTPATFDSPDNEESAGERASVDSYLDQYSQTLRRGGSAAGRKRRT